MKVILNRKDVLRESIQGEYIVAHGTKTRILLQLVEVIIRYTQLMHLTSVIFM